MHCIPPPDGKFCTGDPAVQFGINIMKSEVAYYRGLSQISEQILKDIMKGIFTLEPPWDAALEARRLRKTAIGILFRWGSCWVGAHYSTKQKRLCVNLIPFVTFWIVFKGGMRP